MKAFTVLMTTKRHTEDRLNSSRELIFIKRRRIIGGKTRFNYILNPLLPEGGLKGYIDKDNFLELSEVIKDVLQKEYFWAKDMSLNYITEITF